MFRNPRPSAGCADQDLRDLRATRPPLWDPYQPLWRWISHPAARRRRNVGDLRAWWWPRVLRCCSLRLRRQSLGCCSWVAVRARPSRPQKERPRTRIGRWLRQQLPPIPPRWPHTERRCAPLRSIGRSCLPCRFADIDEIPNQTPVEKYAETSRVASGIRRRLTSGATATTYRRGSYNEVPRGHPDPHIFTLSVNYLYVD
jgi:hypothetical protein